MDRSKTRSNLKLIYSIRKPIDQSLREKYQWQWRQSIFGLTRKSTLAVQTTSSYFHSELPVLIYIRSIIYVYASCHNWWSSESDISQLNHSPHLFAGLLETLYSTQRHHVLCENGRHCRLCAAALQSRDQMPAACPRLPLRLWGHRRGVERAAADPHQPARESETFRWPGVTVCRPVDEWDGAVGSIRKWPRLRYSN